MSNTSLKLQPGKAGGEARDMAVLRDENALLFAQLHVVQQELERRHYQDTEIQRPAGALRLVFDDSRFLEVVAESLRYQKALVTREDMHRLHAERSLTNRLGTAVIEGVSGPAAVFGLPGKLWSIWRDVRSYAPPSRLGGKSYDKVIAAYREGGDVAVDALLQTQPASVKANAMTMLARDLANADLQGAARYARQAYELDPRPFRLKWLAFREHEAGRPDEGEALLDALPANMKLSESEQRQVGILRADAQRKRAREVSEKYDYAARRRELEQRFERLMQERADQQALLEQQQAQLGEQRKACTDLEIERSALNAELATRKVEILGLSQSHDVLRRDHDNLVRDHAALLQVSETRARESAERENLLLAQRVQIEALEQARAKWEQERKEIIERLESIRNDAQESSRAHEEKDALIAQQRSDIEESDRLRTQSEGLRVALSEQVEALRKREQDLVRAHEEKSAQLDQQQRRIEEIDGLRLQWEQQCATLSMRQTALQKDVDALSRVRNEQAELLVRQVDLFGSILGQQHEVANGFIKQISPSGAQLERQLRAAVKEETTNANRQMQALIGLQGYYSNGELPLLNAEASTWPVSPDFALYLVQLIEQKHYDLIVEFGSGLSTAVIGKALAQRKARNPSQASRSTKFVSFEHLPSYHEQTLTRLQAMGVDENVDLRLTPLLNWTAADGTLYSYYDCAPALESLSRATSEQIPSILVMVDGPPAGVGKLARYPAAPLMRQFFPRASIDFVLDDYIREDEQRIAKLWQAELEASGFVCQVSERRLEKGACLISANIKN
ncbi:hypothetical protein [Paraburkholderia lycopersici]|uniref:Uncharacterized protein n=1 Tax=Paraburkholderia lycopersici TaxID=416944 RepID=A0A1G6NHZ8_9BURK|nr:hypothetical protein [Paraburkholderia lycopersici]SDC67251.1 hypothetical protein SAMN05421548_10953 [Paraburkholderia lycopersici]